MKTALVVGVRIDQTREVLSCGLEFDEARQMVTAAIEPGSDAAETWLRNGGIAHD